MSTGVVVPYRRAHEALGVGGVARRRHLDARYLHEPGLQALAVRGAVLHAAAAGGAHDQGHAQLPAQHVAQLRRLVDERVHRQHDEIHEHDLDDGPVARHGGAHARAHDAEFADGRVAHAVAPEFLRKALRHAENVSQLHVLAHDDHALIAFHLLVMGFGQRIHKSDLSHLISLQLEFSSFPLAGRESRSSNFSP